MMMAAAGGCWRDLRAHKHVCVFLPVYVCVRVCLRVCVPERVLVYKCYFVSVLCMFMSVRVWVCFLRACLRLSLKVSVLLLG